MKKSFKKLIFTHSYDRELHITQQICLILQGISILVFFFYFDFTGHWLFELLAVILAFAIAIIFIGMIWLTRLIWNFSDSYKINYIANHPEAAKYLLKQHAESEIGKSDNLKSKKEKHESK